ncbi:MAG TPA: hypothetical protein VH704_09120 [Casimicrobiaceae bacterium]|nr:hypothetical protein [Casimicrobiaceae bacterium]
MARLAALALLALGAWRIAVIVAASPMLGYANQFDMGRTSACFGLWPDLPEPARYEAHPQAPVAHYVRGEPRPAECYRSSELAFVAAALAIAPRDDPVDLRIVGAVKGAALILVALGLDAALKRRPAGALANAAVFAFVLADPMTTLWLNTLYTEFGALLGAYASIGLLAALFVHDPERSQSPPRWTLFAFACSLAALGMSRQQHLLLPTVLALPVLVSLWRTARGIALGLALWVLAIALAQATIARPATITAANNADVVLGAILPASHDQARTAARLGLPERCLQSSGASWYATMGESLAATCPEALAMPRRALAAVAFAEPSTIARAVLRGLPQLQDWRLGYLGSVEGRDFAGSEAVRAVAGPAAISLAPRVTAMPRQAFALALGASLALLIASAGATLVASIRQRPAPIALVIYALTATAWYAILTSILGDGYVEIPRHAQLAAPCMAAALLIIVGALLAPIAGPRRAGIASDAPKTLSLVVASLAIAAIGYIALRGTIVATPLGTGIVDRPKQNRVPDDAVEFVGWALDPRGVARVELVADGGEVYRADYGRPYAGARGEPLALYFPSYPDVVLPGFVAKLPPQALAAGSLGVRTFVVNADGVHTEIDRRRLVVR